MTDDYFGSGNAFDSRFGRQQLLSTPDSAIYNFHRLHTRSSSSLFGLGYGRWRAPLTTVQAPPCRQFRYTLAEQIDTTPIGAPTGSENNLLEDGVYSDVDYKRASTMTICRIPSTLTLCPLLSAPWGTSNRKRPHHHLSLRDKRLGLKSQPQQHLRVGNSNQHAIY